MSDIQLGAVETKFADIIWENAPISSGELVKLGLEKLQWKKSTTFTVLRRLCEKGLFVNANGTVSVKISREEFYSMQSEQFVSEAFNGSLPAFIAAFTSRKQLSNEEINAIRNMINELK